MSASWVDIPWTVLDFETSGTDLKSDRAVQVAVVQLDSTGVKRSLCHVVNPGIEIPQGAIDVHGITNERARAEGLDPAKVVPQVAGIVEAAWGRGEPVLACNASFDVTVLDREMRRHMGRGLDLTGAAVLDPLVIDRACDTYRPGGRKLTDLAAHYKVKQEGAHDALADCLTAARVVWRQARETVTEVYGPNGRKRRCDYSPLRALDLPSLHVWQAERYAEWAEGFELYLHTKADPRQPDAVVDRDWPWRPLVGAGVSA